ncbi:MAG: glycogen/starch/alpha-glucan phosphorylase [Lachnospiraceae bacterium]|nr:glycogen/starch/alpha-glucan phosphorylase [Lachnospiraceae bacterium]
MKENQKNIIKNNLEKILQKSITNSTNEELYAALLNMVQNQAENKKKNTGKKKIYYISAEFLIGKLLSNNLINLGLYDDVKALLQESGKNIGEIEELEAEPSLGNGGLGRLAACFLDSMATLGLPGAGIGLNYHFGLFHQKFNDHVQKETPDPWLGSEKGIKPDWLRETGISFPVSFKNLTLQSKLYEILVTGYENRTNSLYLFDVDSVDENILLGDSIDFDKKDIAKNLTLFLYPDDSDEAGRQLRIYQQYFMVSNGAQLILQECEKRGSNLYDLYDYAVIQINDTHPTMVIPELIRLLTEKGMDMDTAIEVVSKTCAYTNHTILAEALETWPIHYLKDVVPALVPIIEVLDDRIRRKFSEEKVAIIDREDRVHMAHIDIHYGFSVNGVASLHTEILKQEELNVFYKLYPEKFNNKTNGITLRRWLLHCNPKLADFITEYIGDDYKKDALALGRLKELEADAEVLDRLLAIKEENKKELAAYLKRTQNITLQENAIYDIQIKRLHEYKRQQMNALYVIHKYLEIKAGKKPTTPITVIFGAKAAPAYVIAKDIIHLILCLQELVNKDPEVNPYLQVVMVENYNVTLAEKLIPACDISEQISLASKEASGTGNMKFMLNGAVTLGTEDGANVEIHELVGDDNIYIFGAESQTVIDHYKNADYSAKEFYNRNPDIKRAVDFITGKELLTIGNKEQLERLQKEILNKDWFMALLDFEDYVNRKEEAFADYEKRRSWAVKMLHNIAEAGYFSSDRTIAEYNRDIWKC